MENPEHPTSIVKYDTSRDSEMVKFLLEQEAAIETKLMHYRGYYFDRDVGEFVKAAGKEELMNEDGIDFASRMFRRFLNKNSATANLTQEQVSNIILDFSSDVRKILLDRIKRYNIRHLSTVMEVKNDITDMVFLLLTQSINDKGREFIHQGRKMTEVRSLNESPPDTKRKIGW